METGEGADLDLQTYQCQNGLNTFATAIYGPVLMFYCSSLPQQMLYVNATTLQYQKECQFKTMVIFNKNYCYDECHGLSYLSGTSYYLNSDSECVTSCPSG